MKIFNSNISKEEFLKTYWNKKPCLFKNVFPNIESIATKDDFVELALGEFETRLVTLENKKRKLSEGPFTEEELFEKTQSDFTLICHNLNTLSEEFYELEKAVDFLPAWEFDDVMATVSNKGMSLGAHIDDYNVFILQGSGSRHWEIELNPKHEFKDDEEIKVLKEFNADFTWELNPGDMIYIPPHVAHHGISQSDSLSYSIGFNALDTAKLYQRFIAYNLLNDLDKDIYKTKPQDLTHNAIIPSELAPRLREQFSNSLFDEKEFSIWLVKELSQSKESEESQFDSEIHIDKNIPVFKTAGLKYCYIPFENMFYLGVNQREYLVNKEELDFFLEILNKSPFESFKFKESPSNNSKTILTELFHFGDLFQDPDQ